MYCPFCGTDNAIDQKYCRNCGASLPTTTVTKPPTKAHNPVSSSTNPRPSGPFVPPAPPSLPKRSKPLEPILPSLEEMEDPGATNLSYKLPGFAKPSSQAQASNDIVDNFYETQAMGNMINSQNSNKNSKPAPNVDLRTVEMNSLPQDEDLKSTSVGMPIANFPGDNMNKANLGSKSEEYFPTVLTQPKPPESPEEQLRLLKELMEAGGESWKVPPPAPPPPSTPATEQTLSMGALPKPAEANKIDKKAALAATELANKPFDQTLTSNSPSKSHPKAGFDQTLGSNPVLSKEPQKPPSIPAIPKVEDMPFDNIPKTLTMKAAPRGNKEDFSYPNLENSNSPEEPTPDTMQMQRPTENKDIASALNSWSSDVTNPWGSPAPSLSPPLGPDARTEALKAPAPQQEKGKSKKDAFKTISVGPRLQKPGQKDLPTNPLSGPSAFLDDADPNKTAISTAYTDLIPQEKPLPNTAPISLSTEPIESPAITSKVSAPAPNQQLIPPSIPVPLDSKPADINPPIKTTKRSLKIPLLIGLILILVISIIVIAWKLIETISAPQKAIATPTLKPTPIASPSPVATPSPIATPEVATTPEAVAGTENMVLIAGGEYKVGSNEPGPDKDTFSSPQHTVTISAFYMDIYEVTNEQYSKFIEASGYPAPKNWQKGQYPGKAQDPVANVSWDDAQAYAKWANKRLPSEEEWEAAASGQEHFLYPWGNNPDTKRANSKEFGAKSVRAVGSVKTSKSSFGLYDMSGNVWEWTSSPAKPYPNSKDPKATDPQQQRIFRGGSFQDTISYCTTTYRGYESVKLTSPILGFRCAKDAPKK